MYAIIETGGKQFRVEEGTKILVDRMAADVNSEVSLDKVLMVGGAELKVGAPYVENAKVTATGSRAWRQNSCLQEVAPQ